jgi:hypothetical protein
MASNFKTEHADAVTYPTNGDSGGRSAMGTSGR